MARDKRDRKESMAATGRTTRKAGRPVCLKTGKIRYRDGHNAALALEELRKKRSLADIRGGSHTIRVRRKYACPSCGGWHLTSWEETTPQVRAAA